MWWCCATKEIQLTFLGLEITKTRRGFEVRVESLLNVCGLGNSKPSASPSRRSTVMEPTTTIPLDGHDYSNFRTAVGKTHLHGTMATRHAIRHSTTFHTSAQSHNRKQTRSENNCFDISKVHTTLVFVSNHTCRFKMEWLNWLVAVRAGDSSTRQSATGYHCNVQGVTVCNTCLKQTAISLRSCEAEFYGQLLRRTTFGSCRTVHRTSLQSFSSS